jgi:hypothetical protein
MSQSQWENRKIRSFTEDQDTWESKMLRQISVKIGRS